jgi:hypothetical protein
MRYDRPVGQVVEIASIVDHTVSFTTPLHIALDTAHAAQLARYDTNGIRYAGVEGLVDRRQPLLDFCFRCVVRDSYVHDTPLPFPTAATAPWTSCECVS